ncbi:hypothetical protein Tco_0803613 [Tanacetum coccineum]|uniref:Uncharacterized protein n=1 Tax=Tanacetum coccineum TaxID=301880 RepID=A0ABQ5A221_9ASTR
MYHDLYFGEKALVERENVGFDLTKSDLYPSFVEDLTAKGVGLHMAGSHTGNHHEDDFTPLETIRRFLDVIGSRSLSSSNGMPSSQRGGCSPRILGVEVVVVRERPADHLLQGRDKIGCERKYVRNMLTAIILKEAETSRKISFQWLRKGAGSQKDSQICCGQFISKIARKSRVLTEEIVLMTMKHWLVQTQTVFDEELSIPEQTATGKGTSNPLMAGSLPKTTKPT